MNKHELEEVKVRLKACHTSEQFRKVIDSYPDLKDRTMSQVRALIDMNTDILKGRQIGETRRMRLNNAYRYGWGKS